MQHREIEIKAIARQLPGAGRLSAAYIGIAALVAAFIVVFATTSRPRAEVGAPLILTAPFVGKIVPQFAQLTGRL